MRFFKWYLWDAPRNILLAGKNFLLFGWHFFSIGYFAPRLLSPWHRDVTPYGRGFDFKRFFHTFGWNMISRVIGAVLRIVVMAAGIFFEVLTAVATAAWFLIWFMLPIISLSLIILGAGRLTQ